MQSSSHSDFAYEIDVRPLVPPMGDLNYVAKVGYLVSYGDDSSATRLPDPVGERWGHTADEARTKALAAIEEWIASQPRREPSPKPRR